MDDTQRAVLGTLGVGLMLGAIAWVSTVSFAPGHSASVRVAIPAVMFIAGAVLVVWAWRRQSPQRRAVWGRLGGRLPGMGLRRENGVLIVEIRPPERSGRRRLRRETMSLASDIHAYVQSLSPDVFDQRGWSEMVQASQAAATDEDRSRIWNEYTTRSSERSAREAQGLRQRFGGRAEYVMHEFQRRGMLTDQEVLHLDWEMNSAYWIVKAANKIEGLANRL